MNHEEIVFRRVFGVDLRLHVFKPKGHRSQANRPAIVFFSGGGFVRGRIEQFHPQSERLAQRGMVAICAEYRVKERHGTDPFTCLADAQYAMHYVRARGGEFGIDRERVVASGGSAGGHLAAALALLDPVDPRYRDFHPNALVLFNPVLDTSAMAEQLAALSLQGRAAEFSPLHNLRHSLPPTLVLHGTQDEVVPFDSVQHFVERALARGLECRLVPFEGEGHGFFNYGRNENRCFAATMEESERFLEAHGFLK
ncbi:MAG: alpha/beta hydrolase [Pseudomonadales bacterium]